MAEKSFNKLVQFLELNNEELANLCWSIQPSNLGGRGLFAVRDIKKGEDIFTNKPLAVGPRRDHAEEVFCTVCFKLVTCQPCTNCKLMTCSEDCQLSEVHQRDCQFITRNWKVRPDSSNNESVKLGCALIYIKMFLLNDVQQQLLPIFQRTEKTDAEEIEVLHSHFYISQDYVSFMQWVSSIIKVNSYRIACNSTKSKIPLRGLYPLSSFLNHSCIPNTRHKFSEDYSMTVFAAKDIKAGEEIVTCYTGILWCTPARRCQLFKTKKFLCKCERCKDTSEMSTRLSALKCLRKGCVGVLLPVTALDTESEWKCDNCDSLVIPEQIRNIQSALGSLVGTLDLDDQFKLETLVLERLARLIPYSNHIFVDLRLRLSLKLGYSEGLKLNELSECRLSLKESLCRVTLRTLAALNVGDAHLRGLLLYHLHAALAERARRAPALYEDLKPEIESSIEQAYTILQGDISAPPDIELRYRYLGSGCTKPQEEKFCMLDM